MMWQLITLKMQFSSFNREMQFNVENSMLCQYIMFTFHECRRSCIDDMDAFAIRIDGKFRIDTIVNVLVRKVTISDFRWNRFNTKVTFQDDCP